MFPVAWSPFKLEEEGHDSKSSRPTLVGYASSSKASSVAVGLRILIQFSQPDSNVVLNSSLKLIAKPIFRTHQIPSSSSQESCFLKSCSLCHKNLGLDKDVYMYRGDQGFCSVECRSRQIYLDEMREIETSTKKMLASSGHCRTGTNGRRCETSILLEEFRQRRRKPLSCQNDHPVIFSYS